MAAKKPPPRLGRGLASLIGETAATVPSAAHMPITSLKANPNQPRRIFDEESLSDLAQSLRVHGVVQPILVRPIEGSPDMMEIVAGERRWRAAQRAGLHEVPVVVKTLSDSEALEIATIENVQRTDLTPLEEAAAYRQLMQEFNHTQQTLSALVGRSRAHVANMLRLLTLPESVRSMIDAGRLSAGHGRALVGAADGVRVARQIVARNLSVREAEQLVRQGKKSGRIKKRQAGSDPDIRALEKQLSEALGVDVRVTAGSGEKGRVSLAYRTLDQLDEIRRRLMRTSRP